MGKKVSLILAFLLFGCLNNQPSFDQKDWRTVLGEEGPRMASRLFSRFKQDCLTFDDDNEITIYANNLRNQIIKSLNLDLSRGVLSAQLRWTIDRGSYLIEGWRLEIFDKLYLPINVYIPKDFKEQKVPLVITPTAAGSSTFSPHVQTRAANLAMMGMVVIVTEGFARNGSRQFLKDSPVIGYARQLIGLRGQTTVYLQELISAINWTLEHYPVIDPSEIGAAGYSYGGGMSFLLAQVDRRIRSLSIPATGISCGKCGETKIPNNMYLVTELKLKEEEILWSPPLELPMLPLNSGMVLLYPRYFHATIGLRDSGTNLEFTEDTINYAKELYGKGGYRDRILFKKDDGDHHYGRNRREDTYAWFAHTLLNQPLRTYLEKEVDPLGKSSLLVKVLGSTSPFDELKTMVQTNKMKRLRAVDSDRIRKSVSQLRLDSPKKDLILEKSWSKESSVLRIRTFRANLKLASFPVFEFTNLKKSTGRRLIYVPRRGTRKEIDQILHLLKNSQTVISIDYLGIGELKSNETLLHDWSRYFMYNEPSLPKMNVQLLLSLLDSCLMENSPSRWDVYANGWSSSLYAALLKYLRPNHMGKIYLTGVPSNELDFLTLNEKIPDLLLWPDLYGKITIEELARTFDKDEVVFLNRRIETLQ